MPNYILRDVPPDLWEAVRARAAEDGEPLKAVILRLLQRYVAEPGRNAAGGHARAAAMTAEQRSESARQAVTTRWARLRSADSE
jgi:hypothetical protein